MKLVDYSVSVLDAEPGTAAQVKVIITFADLDSTWDTGYVSENIIDASMEALCSGAVVGISGVFWTVGAVVGLGSRLAWRMGEAQRLP